MPKSKEEYTRDMMTFWGYPNNYSVQDAKKNSFELADQLTGLGDKDPKLVDAMQIAINSAESPFELSWSEAVSAFITGFFSLNSSVQTERLNIVAGKIADAIVPAVEAYEKQLKIQSKGKEGVGLEKAIEEMKEISVSESRGADSKPILGERTAKIVGGSQGQSQGQGHGGISA